MAQIEEIIRRLEVMERDGAAAAITRLETRVGAVEKRLDGHSTALVKIIELLEETRMRVSKVEITQEDHTKKISELQADIKGLRRDLPTVVAEAMREVFKERD